MLFITNLKKILGDPFIQSRYEPMVNHVFDEYLGIIEENKNDIFTSAKKRRHLQHIHRKRRRFKKSYNIVFWYIVYIFFS